MPPPAGRRARRRWQGAAGALLALVLGLGVAGERASATGVGELRVGLPWLPTTLDPAVAPAGPEQVVFHQLYEGLVRVGERGELEPGLATHWDVARDGLTWTFRLRADARFHDGTPVTPDAVAAALSRHLAPRRADGTGVRDGLAAWAQVFSGPAALVREVRAREVDVQVHLREAFSPLLAVLAHPALAITLPQNDSQLPFLGTGPYRLIERTPGRLLLEAVPAAGGSPRAARLSFHEIADDAAGVGGLGRDGALDVYVSRGPPAWRGLGLQVLSAPTWRTGLLALKSDEGILANRAARHAVLASLDPALIGPALRPWAEPWAVLLPPGSWASRDAPWSPHNPAQARRLLADARVAQPTLTLLVPDAAVGLDFGRLAEAIRIALAVSGLTVQVRVEPPDGYARALRLGEADLALHETVLELNDPHFALGPLVASGAAARGTATNVAFYRRPLVDAMLQRASQLAFRPERLRLYQRLQSHLAEERPYIPLYARRQWALARATVRGLRLDPGWRHRLDRVWVDDPAEALPSPVESPRSVDPPPTSPTVPAPLPPPPPSPSER
jgi:peptide/nickel transport system substrate-binding protein